MIERLRVWIPAGAVGEFVSPVNFVCQLLCGVHSIPMFQQWHVKDPGHSTVSTGGRLHLNTHTILTQQSRIGLAMLLSRRNVGTYPEMSSHQGCRLPHAGSPVVCWNDGRIWLTRSWAWQACSNFIKSTTVRAGLSTLKLETSKHLLSATFIFCSLPC